VDDAGADVVISEDSEILVDDEGNSSDGGAVGLSTGGRTEVGVKEVSEGAGEGGGDESADWDEGLLNG
jgi:hypothetical protein